MSKYLLGAAAAALLMVGVSSSAKADADCIAAFGALPNSNWSWQVTTGTSVYSFANEDENGQNLFVDVYESSSKQCNAVNPGDNIVASKGGEISGTPVLVDSNVRVCHKGEQTDNGETYDYDC